jgi:ankyrin repeat protein
MQKNRRQLTAGSILYLMLPIKVSSQPYDFESFFNAITIDDVGLVEKLLARKFDPNTPTAEGESALMLSIRSRSMKVFDLLIRHPDININQRNRARESALMLAAFSGNQKVVEILLARSVEVNNTGWTALHYAATHGHVEIMRLLLEHHAFVDAEAPNLMTPLMLAARAGQTEAVRLLLDHGAIDTLKNDAGLTAEDFAIRNGHLDLAEAIKRRRQRQQKPAWLR